MRLLRARELRSALVAGLLALAAAGLNRALQGPLEGPTLLWPVVAITLSALYGGVGIGLLGAALAVWAHTFFVLEPRLALTVARMSDLYRVLLLMGAGTFIAFVAGEVRGAVRLARAERGRAQASAQRLSLSHRLVAALARASTEAEVSEAIFGEGFTALGARTMLISRKDERGELKVVRTVGFPEGVNRAWDELPRDAVLPYAATVTEERAIWIESPKQLAEEYPAAREVAASTGSRSWACVPIPSQGRIVGSFCIGFSDDRRFGPADRAMIESLDATCGQALDRARLFESDRAERLRAERAEEEATRIGALQERLVAVVSHDLRNPLAAVISGLDLMGRLGERDERRGAVLVRTRESAQRMERLIRDLLDFTRARRTFELPTRPEHGDVRDIVRRAVIEVRMAHPGAQIELEADGGCEGLWDPARLEQAVCNLLSNAVEHGGPSEVRVRVHGGEAVARVEIENRGAPIPSERLPALFEPFAPGRTGEPGHLGLGLFIVREIARAHGGTVECSSSEDGVTVFALVLPRGAAVAARDEERRAGSTLVAP